VFGTKNADKVPDPRDPSLDQRVEMMVVAAKASGLDNVAVATVDDAPTFCAKSTLFLKWFKERHGDEVELETIWPMGSQIASLSARRLRLTARMYRMGHVDPLL
jgi:hypothetical protein